METATIPLKLLQQLLQNNGTTRKINEQNLSKNRTINFALLLKLFKM
jgi:hypothetical protein